MNSQDDHSLMVTTRSIVNVDICENIWEFIYNLNGDDIDRCECVKKCLKFEEWKIGCYIVLSISMFFCLFSVSKRENDIYQMVKANDHNPSV